MESIFTAIEKYKPMENMDPQENFLTQIFAWVLREYEQYQYAFIAALKNKCAAIHLAEKPMEVHTQVSVKCEDGNTGLIDMLLENEEMSLIFEHKVGSCLSDNQINKYVTAKDFEGKTVYSILIARDVSQFEQKADVCITWRTVHKLTQEFLKCHSDYPILSQFEEYLLESDMGCNTPFTKEEVIDLWRDEFHYDAKLTRLFRWIESDISKDRTVISQLEKINSDYVFYRGKGKHENRWGRIGIDCLSNDSTFWKPGLFVGVLCTDKDHGFSAINPSMGPDFCIMLEMLVGDEAYKKYIVSDEYSKMVAEIKRRCGEDFSILEAKDLEYRILVLRTPLISVIKNFDNWEVQYDNVRRMVVKGIEIISDCFLWV